MEVTVFDGACTIGGNKIYIEENRRGLFLDFGMNFAKYSQFYEEFFKRKTCKRHLRSLAS